MKNNKIGVCVLTCDREIFFQNCLKTIPPVDYLIVVNDGKPLKEVPTNISGLIQNPRNLGVAVSKNKALRELIAQGCTHLFLIEDDILIKNPNIFEKYIRTAEASGIWHLNWALHGSYNKDENGEPKVKNVIEYEKGIEVAFYHNILGAFSYYLKNVIKHVGYMDEKYKNAVEHIDMTYRIIQKGLHPPFWYFADVAESWNDIEDQTENYEGSKIRSDKNWEKNYREALGIFRYKHGSIPQQLPETPESEILRILEEIQKNYARSIHEPKN